MILKDMNEYIVVGSGMTGAHAAQTLAESGAQVLMLDAGKSDSHYRQLLPAADFVSLRKNDNNQHRYLLGDYGESFSWGTTGTGPQLTPPRKFVVEDVARWLPFDSDTFTPLESLAYGGLGNAWGAVCYTFSAAELQQSGLDVSEMEAAYQTACNRIGISGGTGDVRIYCTGNLTGIQPSIKTEPLIDSIINRYERQKASFHQRGVFLGKPALAMLTEAWNSRQPATYREMEFYDDNEKAVYRPWLTIEELKKKNNFRYANNILVTEFREEADAVIVSGIDMLTQREAQFKAKKLLLAAGVLSTARIVLRSLKKFNHPLPLLCHPYTYIPAAAWSHRHIAVPDRRSALTQLLLILDENKTDSQASVTAFYTYRSLLFIRLLKEVPLPVRLSLPLVKNLLPILLLAGVHHPERYGEGKKIWLKPDAASPTHDRLCCLYRHSDAELQALYLREKKIMRALLQLGIIPLKKVNPGMGSSIHYAGTLPFSHEPKPLHLRYDGLLHFTRNVFIADGSGFRFAPAKGFALTLMANAHRVAQHALKSNQP